MAVARHQPLGAVGEGALEDETGFLATLTGITPTEDLVELVTESYGRRPIATGVHCLALEVAARTATTSPSWPLPPCPPRTTPHPGPEHR